jgi:hypothetical protein
MPDSKQTRDYYRAARKLLPKMDDEMRERISELLQQAEQGGKTDNLIVDIITENDMLRRRLREMLGRERERALAGYSPPGGNVRPVPALKFVCPVEGHHYSRRISKAGEDPGECPIHHQSLIPASSKKRGK